MLAIRLQRTGRKGYATYRMIVQEAKRQPTSGRVVASIGHYNPHTKESVLDTAIAKKYLDTGAQPSERSARLLQAAGVKLPTWVKTASAQKQSTIKNTEKLRRNQPKVTPTEVVEAETAEVAGVEALAQTAEAEPAKVVES